MSDNAAKSLESGLQQACWEAFLGGERPPGVFGPSGGQTWGNGTYRW